MCYISSFQMYNCPQVSVSLNNDYSQAWRMDKYLVNFQLLIYWSTVMQITTFSEKIFHRAFLFFPFFSEDYLKCIQEIRKIKVTLHWSTVLNVEKRRNQEKYFSLFLLSYLGFIAIDWIKTTARIGTLMNLC